MLGRGVFLGGQKAWPGAEDPHRLELLIRSNHVLLVMGGERGGAGFDCAKSF